MPQEANIKNQIVAKLQTLVPATLAEIKAEDFVTDFALSDNAQFPLAVVAPSTIESEAADNRNNLRTYSYEIAIIQRGENITSSSDIENLRQAVMDLFDNDPTLGGFSNGGVDPTSSPIKTIVHADKSYVGFSIKVKPKALVTLTF